MTQPEAQDGNGNNSTTKVLSKLVGQLNIPTLVAVLAMNGWGIGTTQSTSNQREAQIQEALRKIAILHDNLDDFANRQKQELQNGSQILENQREWLAEWRQAQARAKTQ